VIFGFIAASGLVGGGIDPQRFQQQIGQSPRHFLAYLLAWLELIVPLEPQRELPSWYLQ
jgi:hypothetical protein